MKRTVTLRPGARGTKKLSHQFGDQLLYVRYRYDRVDRKRVKTVELVIEERPWEPKGRSPRERVWVKIPQRGNEALRKAIMEAGGTWSNKHRLWRMTFSTAEALGLAERIVSP